MTTILHAKYLKITNGEQLLCSLNGTWQLRSRERVGIIGHNGAGKSTLLAVLAGRLVPEEGTVQRLCSLAEMKQAAGARGNAEGMNTEQDALALDEAGGTIKRWKALEREEAAAHGSGGERTRLQIAELFASGAELLLADEPTSHLDETGIKQLEEAFRAYEGSIVFVSHDRQLLDSVCTSIIALEDGVMTVYKGNYSDYRKEYEAKRERAMFEYEQYASEKKRLERALLDVRQASASMKKKPSRMSYKEANLGKAGARTRQAKVDSAAQAIQSRIEKLEVKHKPREADIPLFDAAAHEPCRSKHVLRLEELSFQLPERRLLERLRIAVRPGMRIAITGVNGAGKTTLLRLIHDDAEGVMKSPGCRIGYFRQDLSLLDDAKSVLDNVLSTSVYNDTHVRTVLARTLFKGQNVFKAAGMLSGGERGKAALAKLFLGPYNTLLIDEPTNYLDIYAREQLEQTLCEYPGTILFAAHDRRLVQETATHTLVLTGDGAWTFSEGAGTDEAASKPVRDQDYEMQLLRLEHELAETIGRLSLPASKDELEQLELRFQELLAEKRQLQNK